MSSYCRAAGATWQNEEGGDMAEDLPKPYREFTSVFSKEEIIKLPEYSSSDHEIKQVEGATPPFGLIYPLNEKELGVLREYINENLAVWKIRVSNSPAGSPILFVPKADNTLCLCVDY